MRPRLLSDARRLPAWHSLIVLVLLVDTFGFATSSWGRRSTSSTDHVVVDQDGRIFVYRAADYGRTVTAVPGEPAYDAFMELAGWPARGQSRPLRQPVATFELEADGDLLVRNVLAVRGGGSEAIAVRIQPTDPRYQCYRLVLRPTSAAPRHYVFPEDQTKLARCD